MTEKKKIFIVGSSRSGTTMLARILGNHPDIYAFEELHFFEFLVDARVALRRRGWSERRRLEVLERLLTSSRDGFFSSVSPGRYRVVASEISATASGEDPLSVYENFLDYECARHGKRIPCEQTPRYIFSAGEILAAFPEARIINLIRDPRAVMLSQKNKWRRRQLGAATTPVREVIRSWVNYHPYLIARLWKSAVTAAELHEQNRNFLTVRFEDIVSDPQKTVERICDFVGINYSPELLDVPQIGSSVGADSPDTRGIDSARASAWQRGGLSDTEIDICQRVCRSQLAQWNYKPRAVHESFWKRGLQIMWLPIQTSVALMLNMGRVKNIVATVRRRVFPVRTIP